MTTHHTDGKKPADCGQKGIQMSHGSPASEVQLTPIPHSFNAEYQVIVGGTVVGVVTGCQMRELVERQIAHLAPSSIALGNGSTLTVYEKRSPAGTAGSGDALRLEIGQGCTYLSATAARSLAYVLLTYAGAQNQRGQWLVRQELG